MQDKFLSLRKEHPVFTFENYTIVELNNKLLIKYYFKLGNYASFSPTWEFIKKNNDVEYKQDEIVDKLAFNLGMVELISYWKLACSPKVIVKAGYLDEDQVNWWKDLYYLGLGEFFYVNSINTDYEGFMNIEISTCQEVNTCQEDFNKCEPACVNKANSCTLEKTIKRASSGLQDLSGYLIPIGGGKDSIVTLELLKDYKDSNLCYMINEKEASLKTAQVAGYSNDDIVIANRNLDKTMLRLNNEGFLNGHTPFSAIVAFSSVLMAYLNDKAYVVLSNESSANESTVEGTMVNHQYSKSFKFEQDFLSYEEKYIGSGIRYFSLLRPYTELQIARFFSRHEKYYEVFRSCNVGSKLNRWCCLCPKCLFVYIILSPFISSDTLIKIFGKDMLNNESLLPIFNKLIGIEPEKPFECVGTCDEVNTAICMAIKRMKNEQREIPCLYKYYMNIEKYKKYINNDVSVYLDYYDNNNNILDDLANKSKYLMLNLRK